MKKINVITLGCSKNTVDSEHLMAQLAAAGYTVTHDSDRTDAKVVVINTCGFIGDAKQESIDMILRAAAAKQTGKIERLFVVGCLSERYAEELRAELPEVDEFFGVKDWDDIVRALEATPRPALATERRLTTPKHYAYLKISEGCNWKCGYCAIPLIRGPHASVPMETLLEEARKLAAGGVRELIVIAQDTTYYGIDLYGRRMLAELLRRLCRIDGIRWIRVLYAYPERITDEFIAALVRNTKVVPYLDLPIQHCDDAVLKAMNRRGGRKEIEDAIHRLRKAIPGITLRTTLIAGFPGETEEQYAELCDFVKTMKFDRLGCFAYSAEENTVAAKMDGQLDEETKQRRADHIMELQAEVSAEREGEKVGQTLECVCDGVDDETGMYLLRSKADCPEIDGNVLTPADTPLETGAFYNVTITDSDTYDLYGYVEEKLED